MPAKKLISWILVALIAGTGCRRSVKPPVDATAEQRGVAIESLRYRAGDRIPTGLLTTHADVDSLETRWYSRQLAALQEDRIVGPSDTGPSDAYRFLWLRSFHHPVAVRIYRRGSTAVVVTSEGAGAGGYAPGALMRRDSSSVSMTDWRAFIALLEAERFWERPAGDSVRSGVDGAQWVVEGRRGNRYSVVARWSPTDLGPSAFMRRLGLAFLQVGRLDVPRRDLY